MSRPLGLYLLVILCTPFWLGRLVAAQGAEPAQLLLPTQAGPVLLELQLEIDGKPADEVCRQRWQAYASALFTHLDRNKNGWLEEKEARLIPPISTQRANSSGMPVNVAFNFLVLDVDSDGRLSRDEVLGYFLSSGQPASSLKLVQRPNQNYAGGSSWALLNTRTFFLLDTNADGKLSADELTASPKVLSTRDLDRNELVTAHELVPNAIPEFPPPQVQAVEGAGVVPVVSQSEPSSDTQPELKILSAEEGKGLGKVVATAKLHLRLGKRAAELPACSVTLTQGTLKLEVKTLPSGNVLVQADTTQLELNVSPGQPRLIESHQASVLTTFRSIVSKETAPKLSKRRAQESGFYFAQFDLLDADGDGSLTEAELRFFFTEIVPKQVVAYTTNIELACSGSSVGLFDLLDSNHDGKLSLRELREANRFLALDQDGDKQLSQPELTRYYRTCAGLFEARFGSALQPGTFTPPGSPWLKLDWLGGVSVWFQKMDRNRDGDVSLGEFLGTPADFRQLDTDGDGLLSHAEALAADAGRK